MTNETGTMDAYMRIEELVKKAINVGDYNFIREAMKIAYTEGIDMCEDDEFVMVEDEVFYFNGAF